jgi:subtilisin family serine protease
MGADTHGTHVAGTMGAVGNNGVGITGVSQDVSLLPIRIFADNDKVPLGAVVNAYVYAGMMGAHVANGSFGGAGGSTIEIEALEASPNTLFVVAAGNSSTNNDSPATPVFPCNYGAAFAVDNVICVAATNPNDALAGFSNIGPATVHLSAPGTAILSTSRHATELEEGFEGVHGWSLDSPWAAASDIVFGGTKSLSDSPGGSYVTGSLDKSAINVADSYAGKTGCFLHYVTAYQLESGDKVDILGSTNGGSSWLAAPLRTITGTSPGYPGSGVSHTTSLAPLNGSANARIRFRLVTDGDPNVADGIHVDELAIRCNSASGNDGGYQYLQGTSMASPHVAGAAALMHSHQPSANPFSLRNALMVSGDLLPVGELGKTISNRRLNVDALLDKDAIPLGVPTVGGSALSKPFQKKTSVAVSTSTPGASGYWIKIDRTRYNRLSFTRSFVSSSGSKTLNLAAGSTHCVSANSIQPGTGNESNFSTKRCTSVPVNNTSLKHSSGWKKKKAPGHFLKTFSQSSKKGATLSLSGVIFDRLALVATKCRGCGTVGIFSGRQKFPFKKVNLSSTRTKKLQIITVFSKKNGPYKSKITIKVLTSGKPVKIEGFGVLLKPLV